MLLIDLNNRLVLTIKKYLELFLQITFLTIMVLIDEPLIQTSNVT